ncbi:diguanylate cyclase (GGDEF) domain-containing protein [Micromonospora pattaloongensis]|uniref:Diguanylate cyclase (GGDEF) domain-containing protein n=1 Tax=Micromonospora pattaloongensis TaxID=405436 RepID=A0A1H3Q8U0_9ACTN|nr:GGDEF domain-containing protein [Micromonospora pattaloongensis]SDZ09571.1 diguanylate cyclase (GGDEF) domain-containing protein [Micromonospora pattaloongensis]
MTVSSHRLGGLGDDRATVSGRTAGFLFVACGFYGFITLPLPTPPGFNHAAVSIVALAAVTVGLIVRRLPWHRIPTAGRLTLAPAAMALVAVHNVASGNDPFRYGAFFFIVYIWMGLFEARWVSLKMTPFALLAYVLPLLRDGISPSVLASISYAVPLFAIVGEVLAWRTARLQSLQHRLRYLAEHDSLTGLYNRVVFVEALRAACEERAEAAVIFIDLDGFKQINDRLGHDAGDRVLVEVADALRRSVRADRQDLPCRLAGDEFVVLVRDADPERAARDVAERLVGLLAEVGPADHPVRASVGIASGTALESRDIVRAADEAMYAAKHSGAGLVAVTLPRAA